MQKLLTNTQLNMLKNAYKEFDGAIISKNMQRKANEAAKKFTNIDNLILVAKADIPIVSDSCIFALVDFGLSESEIEKKLGWE